MSRSCAAAGSHSKFGCPPPQLLHRRAAANHARVCLFPSFPDFATLQLCLGGYTFFEKGSATANALSAIAWGNYGQHFNDTNNTSPSVQTEPVALSIFSLSLSLYTQPQPMLLYVLLPPKGRGGDVGGRWQPGPLTWPQKLQHTQPCWRGIPMWPQKAC